MTTTTPFESEWTLWYHADTTKWTPSSFKQLCTISTVEDFWEMIDAITKNTHILLEHIYVMRGKIIPMWEHPENSNGGCWSIKIDISESFKVFTRILAYICGETSMYTSDMENMSNQINGISLCQKNNYSCIIQIWNRDKTNNQITLLPKDITERFSYEIIYRPHIPEKGVVVTEG
jgi:hypothetical protein